MSEVNTIQYKKLRFVSAFFFIFALAIMLLLARWQIGDNEEYIAIANERSKNIRIPSVRGNILAQDGSSLAFSAPCFNIYIWKPDIDNAEKVGKQTRTEFIEKVSAVLEYKDDKIKSSLDSGSLWIKIASKITPEKKDQLMMLKSESGSYLDGMHVEYANKRVYPEGKLASQLLGYVGLSTGTSGRGIWGVEQYWDGVLKPQEGWQIGEYDSFGNPIAINEASSIESKPGSTIYTTIDKRLQQILEEKLKEGYDKYIAKSATGIIMDPKTGAILAMANYPNFDPNVYFNETDPSVFGNKAITDPYEIGSVAKMFTLASALDLGTVQPDTMLLPEGHKGCEIISPDPSPLDKCVSNETRKRDDKIIDCICTYNRKPSRSSVTVKDALIASDNIGFRHIALSMTYKDFYTYLSKFGAGRLTYIDLPGESYAPFKAYDQWNYADQAVYSYGHGYSMTPIEVVSAIGAIANNGERMQPYVVSKIVDSDGKTVEFNPKVVEKVLKPQTSATISQMLHQVYVNQLIEKRFKYLSKYYICLKSGTALIPHTDKAGYSSEINTTFAGFDASIDKKFVLFIKLEKPQIGELSYYNARILWLETFMAMKDYMHISEK